MTESQRIAEAAGWRTIDSAPKDEIVLVFIPDAPQGMSMELAMCSSDDPDGDWYRGTVDGFPIDVPPTHWMPLPEPPK